MRLETELLRRTLASRRRWHALASAGLVIAVAALAINLGLPGQLVPSNSVQASLGTVHGLAAVAAPPGTYAGTMVYDAADGYVLLFGGLTASGGIGGSNDTWAYRNGTWTQLHPAVSPPGRAWAMMAYDPAAGYVVLFGGSNASPAYHDLHDTWIFKGGSWTELQLALHPSARDSGMMTYDSTDGYVLLFGGAVNSHTRAKPVQKSTVFYNDTWTFTGGRWWQLLTISHGGPFLPRADAMFNDNPSGKNVLLLGGEVKTNGAIAYGTNRSWAFSNGSWAVAATCQIPGDQICGYTSTDFGVMSYDARASRMVMFETNIQIYCPGELGSVTLARSAGAWSVIQVCKANPVWRDWSMMTYDAADGYLLLFGGTGLSPSGSGFLNDTWAFDRGTWHAV
jgi:hypothetical protein